MIDRVFPFQASTTAFDRLTSSPAVDAVRPDRPDGRQDSRERPRATDEAGEAPQDFKDLVLEADTVVLEATPVRQSTPEPFQVSEVDRDLPPGSYVDIFV